jgi:hypothetical protein
MFAAFNIFLTGTSLDPDVAAWRDAIAANGGTVSAGTIASVEVFVKGLKADSLWDSLLEIGVFAGVDNLAAALVKLKMPSGISRTLTNVNMVSGDYTASGSSAGLQGNGTTKYLNTLFPQNTVATNNRHLGAYSTFRSTAGGTGLPGDFSTVIGGDSTGVTKGFVIMSQSPRTTLRYYCGATDQGPTRTTAGTGHHIGNQQSGTTGLFFKNGGSKLSTAVTDYAPTANALGIFTLLRNGSPLLYSNERITFYHIGTGLSDAQVATLSTRVNTLMTAFGCNTY